VFRRLKAIGYRSSFNHAGRYYTLADVPQFNQWGLWFHRHVGFSCTGTLKATVVALVEGSAAGMTPKELLALLKLPVANTLYNTLPRRSTKRTHLCSEKLTHQLRTCT
jgi:hypothetical protein